MERHQLRLEPKRSRKIAAPTFAPLPYTNLRNSINPISAALAPSTAVMIGAAMIIIGASIGPETIRKQLE